MGHVDIVIGTFNSSSIDKIDISVTVANVIASQSSGLTLAGLTVDALNSLLNSATGTGTKFTGIMVDVAILTTTDARTVIAIDADHSGSFTATDYLIEITGSTGLTATEMTPVTFI